MAYPDGGRNPNGAAPCFGRDCVAGLIRCADVDTSMRCRRYECHPSQCGFTADEAPFQSDPLHCRLSPTLPLAAQTPPTQGWPANRPPDQSAPAGQAAADHADAAGGQPQATTPTAPGAPAAPGAPPAQQAVGTPPPVPLPQWFAEIDTEKKGEVTRAEFLKYRMKSFEELDANKDGKLTLEEFIKVAEPPFSADVPERAEPRGAQRTARGPNSRTSTPIATASSSAPRPRRWCIPSSTSTTRTATTR